MNNESKNKCNMRWLVKRGFSGKAGTRAGNWKLRLRKGSGGYSTVRAFTNLNELRLLLANNRKRVDPIMTACVFVHPLVFHRCQWDLNEFDVRHRITLTFCSGF